MKIRNKFTEKDIVCTTHKEGLSVIFKSKRLIRVVAIKYFPETKKGKAIGQILDGVKRLL